MALQVSFRVVGLYCYFENLQLPDVSPQSTVQEVMDAVKAAQSAFDYEAVDLGGKSLVDTMSYTYGPGSKQPYNSSLPPDGFRDLSNTIASKSVVWQYYRSVTGTINGTNCELKLFSKGQPSFSSTPLDLNQEVSSGENLTLPEGFQINTYNLTWRLVTIQMSPERQAAFMLARANAIKAKY